VIHGGMTVTEFVMILWNNKIKVGLLILAVIFGPGLYDDWQKKRTAEQLEADRKSVDTDASIAGMMLMNAWTSCRGHRDRERHGPMRKVRRKALTGAGCANAREDRG